MARNQNRISRFWQELKRRGVIQVITVYASSSFALIEIINNLTEPLNLPTSLSTIVIIVLAVSFPLVVILSWLYDLTSGSLERTKPVEDISEEEKTKVPNAWKIATYISFAVIAGLIVLNIISRDPHIKPGMIKSIAILPFDNFTGDDELNFVAAGMHSSLIGDMGKVGALRVIGKTSSNVFKNTDKSAPEIASELKVDALVEPTLICYGDTVCIQIRVITSFPEEKQIWVADYREDKRKILNLYNRMAQQIADELMINLSPEEMRLLSKSNIVNKNAYEEYMRGLYLMDDFDKESLLKAIEYLNSAVDKDPSWAILYSSLAEVWTGMVQMGFETPEIAGPKIFENLNKAQELDPDNADLHYIKALIAFVTEWDWDKAEQEFLKALALNPSHALARTFYAQLLSCLQRPAESKNQAALALGLDPLNLLLRLQYSQTITSVGDCKNGLAEAEKITAVDPGHYFANNLIENAAICCQDYDKVMKAAKYILPVRGISMDTVEIIYKQKGFTEAYKEVLRQSEELVRSNNFLPVEMAVRYMWVNEHDKALEWFEKGFEMHDQTMPYIATKTFCIEPIFKDPRFIDILNKMNLPLPKSDIHDN